MATDAESQELARRLAEQKQLMIERSKCSMEQTTWEDCEFAEKQGKLRLCTKRTVSGRALPSPCNMFKRKPKELRDIYLKHRCCSEDYKNCEHRERKWFCSHVMYGGREPESPCPHYKARGRPKSNPRDYVDITMFGGE